MGDKIGFSWREEAPRVAEGRLPGKQSIGLFFGHNMRRVGTLLAVLILLQSASAAFGDQYAAPEYLHPESMQTPGKSVAGSGADPNSLQMKLTLADSIALALHNNRNLINARLSRIVEQYDLEVAEDEFWPDLTVGPNIDLRSEGASQETDREYLTDSGVSDVRADVAQPSLNAWLFSRI